MLIDFFNNSSKHAFILAFLMLLSFINSAQINAFYSDAVFNTPKNQSFLETYLTISSSSLSKQKKGNQFQNSIQITLKIMQDSQLVKINKYNLLGPTFCDTCIKPSFIDVQRYSLNNGIYNIQLQISDNYDKKIKPLQIESRVKIDFNPNQIQNSSIELVETFTKTNSIGILSKSGYDLIPYTINYFPEATKNLNFYFEAYHADTIIGKNKPVLFYYYIEESQQLKKLNEFGSFKKQIANEVNPLLGKINISKLASGNYNLVIELKDENNITHLQQKIFFQRLNKQIDNETLTKNNNIKNVTDYFGKCNHADTLKMFVECLWPIADGIDKDRIINQAIKKEPELMKKFVIDFWQRRANDTVNPLNLWANYYKNVQTVMANFKCGKQKGYYSERGRVYLQYGAPNQRSQQKNEQNTFPYEIWQYYSLTDGTNKQRFTNRKFVFVNKNLGDDCYTMIHSDMRGEIYNDRWQFEITRRNSDGVSNPDNTAPKGTEFNQFNEIYNNPR